MTKPLIYLASASPRRRELLTQIGVPFELIRCEIDETPQHNERPYDYVARLARAKAAAGVDVYQQQGLAPRLLLAADTTVALGETILGKPIDTRDAEQMLANLAGRTHQVLTGVAISDGERVELVVSVSDVTFRTLSTDEIATYVASGEPIDKAGAYGAQGLGALLIEKLSGSFSGVVGLPLAETGILLRRFAYPI